MGAFAIRGHCRGSGDRVAHKLSRVGFVSTSMNDLVVLLHGLGRTPASMLALACAARRRGYSVLNWATFRFLEEGRLSAC